MDAREWDERYAESELVWSATPNRFVEAELAGLSPGRAVDVACGEGRNSLWLADRGWEVTAVDFSMAGLDKARARQVRHEHGREMRVEWVHADVLQHDFGREAFDLAVLAYLQLPPDERRTVVRRAYHSLRVGGTLFVVAHDTTNLTEGTGGPQDPSVLFTAEDVLDDLDGERLEVRRAERVTRTTDSGETAYDCLVRVVRSE